MPMTVHTLVPMSMVACPLPTSTDDPRGPYSAALLPVVGHDGPLQTVVMVLGCRRKHELLRMGANRWRTEASRQLLLDAARASWMAWICRRHAACMQLLVMAVLSCS
jgi:hypothetical protein